MKLPTVSELRQRFPRLTAPFSDEQLEGGVDVTRLPSEERYRMARELVDRTIGAPDDERKLRELDCAVKIAQKNGDVLANRGVVHAALGNLDAALADLDASLAVRSDAPHVQWERSKVRLAKGDRAGAISDARGAAERVSEARAWLSRPSERSTEARTACKVRRRNRHLGRGHGGRDEARHRVLGR
ncbi:MAG TPA: hypothetical protein VM925_23860 [Labilithrix sp.]|nr:hypothetical protein [Labilithrix sp.]